MPGPAAFDGAGHEGAAIMETNRPNSARPLEIVKPCKAASPLPHCEPNLVREIGMLCK